VLEEAQRRGLIGPGPLEPQVHHALGMGEAAGGSPEGAALDLGTGGGLPGLVLATHWPASRWVLLDSRRRSVDFCREAVGRLNLGVRVEVIQARAEVAGRDPRHRGRYDLVTARGFGPPAVTAECAAPLLASGGRLVVSEPPGAAGGRWPERGLSPLGLELVAVAAAGEAGFALLQQVAPCPDGFPRREGVPRKRPLF
jgi:16S rRNA (guanine527-N7)-methyltransferase